MASLADVREFFSIVQKVRDGTESESKAFLACLDLKSKIATSSRDLRDLKTQNDRRRMRVKEFYTALENGGVSLESLFDLDIEPDLDSSSSSSSGSGSEDAAPLGEAADFAPPEEGSTPAQPLPPPAPHKGPAVPPPIATTAADKGGSKSPNSVTSSEVSVMQPEWWICIGQKPLEEQVVVESAESVVKRYTKTVKVTKSIEYENYIPNEVDVEALAQDHKDVFRMLQMMRAVRERMTKAINVIEAFERDYVSPMIHVGMPQNVVMHLIRGQPYEKEFQEETEALDKTWENLKEARDECDKNSKDSAENLADSVGNSLKDMQAEMNANVEDLNINVIKILDLLNQTNKTISMSLSEQAALRKNTAKEKIFTTVVDLNSDKAANLAFLKDVCQEYKEQLDVLDWVHPKVKLTALFLACLNNYHEVVEIFAQSQASINLRLDPADAESSSAAGWTYLTIAASRQSKESVGVLLRYGSDCNLPNQSTGQTAAHYATLKGDVEILGMLIAAPGININAPCSRGLSPIQTGLDIIASQSAETLKQKEGVIKCISLLMLAGAYVHPEAMIFAASKPRCVEALQAIISHSRFDRQLLDVYVEGMGNVLYSATEQQNYDGLSALVGAGANASKVLGKRKSAPVLYAVGANDSKALGILLSSPTLNLAGETLLLEGKSCVYLAVEKGSSEILNQLLDKIRQDSAASSIINLPDKQGRTPLLRAVQLKFAKGVELLASFPGCDHNLADVDGRTPAFAATEAASYSILVTLFKAGANLRKACGSLGTALTWITTKMQEFDVEGQDVAIDIETEEEAEDEDGRFFQIFKLLGKVAEGKDDSVVAPKSGCGCAIS